MTTTYDYSDRPVTGLDGSRLDKEADKDLYSISKYLMVGSGITMEYVWVTESGDLISDPTNVPWGDKHKVLKISLT